jgi:nucleotide-binding universal stress UspA family protein
LVIESRHIAKSLREAAADVTLVVIAEGQRGVARRLLRRSVTDALMRTLPCPLLIVRSHTSVVDLASDPMPQHVLVPLNGTMSAETAIDFAAALGGRSGARFTLTHFQTLEQTLGSRTRTDSHGYLRSAAERFSEHSPQISTEVLIDDQEVATAVLSRVESTGIDLIALTKSKRTGLAQLLNPSVADAVVRKASTPVLVLHSTIPRAKNRESSANRSFWNWRRATAAFVNA